MVSHRTDRRRRVDGAGWVRAGDSEVDGGGGAKWNFPAEATKATCRDQGEVLMCHRICLSVCVCCCCCCRPASPPRRCSLLPPPCWLLLRRCSCAQPRLLVLDCEWANWMGRSTMHRIHVWGWIIIGHDASHLDWNWIPPPHRTGCLRRRDSWRLRASPRPSDPACSLSSSRMLISRACFVC